MISNVHEGVSCTWLRNDRSALRESLTFMAGHCFAHECGESRVSKEWCSPKMQVVPTERAGLSFANT
jgi:hypothetical protein